MPGKVKEFYDIITKLKETNPDLNTSLDKLKGIYDETRAVITKIVGGISDIVHSNYIPDLFNLEDFNEVKRLGAEKPPKAKRFTDTITV